MTEVLFYHLTESTLEEALPSLLERSLERGWRATVQTASEERRDVLDTHLWTYRDDSFLAHGTEGAPHAEHQPILLTTGTGNANGSQVRFVVEGAEPPDFSTYARGVIMFDGHDEDQLSAARRQWTGLKAAGHEVTYWQQGPDRRWQKKA